MIPVVGSTIQTPPQSAAPVRPAEKLTGAPDTNTDTDIDPVSATAPVTVESEAQENVPVAPLSPENLKTVLSAQGEGESPFDSELTEEEKEQVRELKQIDAEVRAHEQAHKTAGGPVSGSVSFETITGPDGREYAVAGEVQIDASPVANNPEATIRKMDLVIRAALAPAEPSSQDRAVAAAAQQAKLQAQQEAALARKEEQEKQREDNGLGILSQGNQEDNDDSSLEIVSILFGNGAI